MAEPKVTIAAPQPLSPSSVRTSGSFRSPTMWTNFDDSEDYEVESGPSHSPKYDGDDSRNARSSREMGASSDLETRNLIENDATSEASEVPSLDEDPFSMTDEQRQYYRAHFLRLMTKTYGMPDSSGALRGADEEVIEFFRKSTLDRDSLSKIWALADVNQDGYLNCDEFAIAFHLIVLLTKGGIPLPDYLPAHVAPPPTPPRLPPSTTDSAGETSPSAGGAEQLTARNNWTSTAATDAKPISASPQLQEFSSAPPLVEKPVPVKFSASNERIENAHQQQQPSSQLAAASSLASKLPLSPATRKGPPPKPPPRPAYRGGHARSASLDLTHGKLPGTAGPTDKQLPINTDIASSAATIDATSNDGGSSYHVRGLALDLREVQTQTDGTDIPDVGVTRKPTLAAMVDFDKATTTGSLSELEGGVNDNAPLDWKGRCECVRLANTEKERELARWIQMRKQLEMKLEEFKTISEQQQYGHQQHGATANGTVNINSK